MDERCRRCHREKGAMICILENITKIRPDLVECPCFECLVKVTCKKQCEDRTAYFNYNISDFQIKIGETIT
jgi:hypothetical protein